MQREVRARAPCCHTDSRYWQGNYFDVDTQIVMGHKPFESPSKTMIYGDIPWIDYAGTRAEPFLKWIKICTVRKTVDWLDWPLCIDGQALLLHLFDHTAHGKQLSFGCPHMRGHAFITQPVGCFPCNSIRKWLAEVVLDLNRDQISKTLIKINSIHNKMQLKLKELQGKQPTDCVMNACPRMCRHPDLTSFPCAVCSRKYSSKAWPLMYGQSSQSAGFRKVQILIHFKNASALVPV